MEYLLKDRSEFERFYSMSFRLKDSEKSKMFSKMDISGSYQLPRVESAWRLYYYTKKDSLTIRSE